MCQVCVDDGALSQATYDSIQQFLIQWPSAESGPAHIVLSDCNIEDGHIQWCLENLRKAPNTKENIAVDGFLRDLLETPSDER